MTEEELITRLNSRERKLYEYVSGYTGYHQQATFKCSCCGQKFKKAVSDILNTTSTRCRHNVSKLKNVNGKYITTDLLELDDKGITIQQIKINLIANRYEVGKTRLRELWAEGYRGKRLIDEIGVV